MRTGDCVNIVVGGRGAGGTEERQWAGLVGELVFGMAVPGNAFGCKSLNNVTNSSFFSCRLAALTLTRSTSPRTMREHTCRGSTFRV